MLVAASVVEPTPRQPRPGEILCIVVATDAIELLELRSN